MYVSTFPVKKCAADFDEDIYLYVIQLNDYDSSSSAYFNWKNIRQAHNFVIESSSYVERTIHSGFIVVSKDNNYRFTRLLYLAFSSLLKAEAHQLQKSLSMHACSKSNLSNSKRCKSFETVQSRQKKYDHI